MCHLLLKKELSKEFWFEKLNKPLGKRRRNRRVTLKWGFENSVEYADGNYLVQDMTF
jgi:hypothetical protein